MSHKFACVFPGQGSQHLGMLKELAEIYPIVTKTFAQASEVLGYDLWEISQNGPSEKLNQTEITQPALLAAGYAVWLVLQEKNFLLPTILAGHSLGEYTALVAANTIDFPSAISLVAKRGRYMQEAVPMGLGGMAAIVGLENEKIKEICDIAAEGEVLEPANMNAPGQIVIAGHKSAVKRAMQLATKAEARLVIEVAISVPSHCSLMKSAAEKLAKDIAEVNFQTPKIAVINNVDAKILQNPNEIKDALIRQIYNPVLWIDSIVLAKSLGITTVLELGPGRVLTGLVKRIDRTIETHSINDPVSLEKLEITMVPGTIHNH